MTLEAERKGKPSVSMRNIILLNANYGGRTRQNTTKTVIIQTNVLIITTKLPKNVEIKKPFAKYFICGKIK